MKLSFRRAGYLASKILLCLLYGGFAGAALGQSVNVTAGGTPNFTLPLTVPPGMAGMTPSLALLYSGSSLNGPVGLGWTVQGISSITRCPSNKQIDGHGRAVNYTSADKLCLDGQRLIQTDANGLVVNGDVASPGLSNPFQVDDSAGGNGMVREYRTEKDIYARIRAFGGDALNGPAYFKVWTKSGQIYEYGNASNAGANAAVTASGKAVIAAWNVSRISDTLGNFIDFQYSQRETAWGTTSTNGTAVPGREWNLQEIRYTGNGSQDPVNRVLFEYEDRPATADRSEAYHLKSKTVSISRLKAIRTFINWPGNSEGDLTQVPQTAIKVKTYKIAYQQAPTTQRSLVSSVKECAGAQENKCLPATTFAYHPGGSQQYQNSTTFSVSGLATATLMDREGKYGVLLGNFFGSGKTDIIRWSDNENENQLYRSVGDGTFEMVPIGTGPGQFNLTMHHFFKSNECYTSTVADFNGDGRSDILRTMNKLGRDVGGCGETINLLFLSNGDGSFTTRNLSADPTISNMDLERISANRTTIYECVEDGGAMARTAKTVSDKRTKLRKKGETQLVFAKGSTTPMPAAQVCNGTMEEVGVKRTLGKTFYVIDVNNDGLLDIVQTIAPAFPQAPQDPDDAVLCANTTCTRVFLAQDTGGTFLEKTDTNVAQRSLYTNPSGLKRNSFTHPYVGDLNGDGLADLSVDTGYWESLGNGNFDSKGYGSLSSCEHMFDFNGDGRIDCLYAYGGNDPAIGQYLQVADGGPFSQMTSNFNLTSLDDQLMSYLQNNPNYVNMDVITVDMDGDGREDLVRWSDSPGRNRVYLSNGDGTFRIGDFNLTTGADQLRHSDGSADFVLGDFTGHGNIEILRMKPGIAGGAGPANTLYLKTEKAAPDLLKSVTTSSGLKTELAWVPLSNSTFDDHDRYYIDTGANAAQYPKRDLITPQHVVARLVSDSGTGTAITTDYAYVGLKASYVGDGMLGFRKVLRQSQTPGNTNMTVLAGYLQDGYSNGMVQLTRSWLGNMWGDLDGAAAKKISEIWNVYCDTTAPTQAKNGADTQTPCVTTAKVRRPYLYAVREQGWDNNVALPTVETINTYNDYGDPTTIKVSTTGTALGMPQQFVKTTTNSYLPANTAGDAWILGRLERSTVEADNRVNTTPPALAAVAPKLAAARATAGARTLAASAVPDLWDIQTVQAAQIASNVNATSGTPYSISKIPTVVGNGPYAGAVQGVPFSIKLTPAALSVVAATPGLVSGDVSAVVNGGTPPFQYSWTRMTGDKSAISDAASLTPNISATLALGDDITEYWKLTVSDSAFGLATAVMKVRLAVPAQPLTVSVLPSPLRVDANDPGEVSGLLTATAAGGIPPHTYQWVRTSGSKTTVSDAAVLNPTVRATLAAGESLSEQWRVTVTDAAAKTANQLVDINFTAPAALAVPLAASHTAILNTSTGVATASVSVLATGGRAPYTYLWERTSGTRSGVNDSASNTPVVSAQLNPGDNFSETWRVTATDSVGHTATANTVVSFSYPPAALALNFDPASPREDGADPGVVTVNVTGQVSGGVQPYTYAWTRYSGSRTTVADAGAATAAISATLTAGQTLSEIWRLTVTDAQQKTVVKNVTVTLTAPSAMSAPLSTTRTAVLNSTTGIATSSISVTPSGGRAPYTFLWERTAGTRSEINNAASATPVVTAQLTVGDSFTETWRMTVSDSAGHTVVASTTITFSYPAPAMALSFTPTSPRTDAPDPGLVSVAVTGNASGGVPPYSYAWSRYTGSKTSIQDATTPAAVISASLGAGESASESWRLTVTDSRGVALTGQVTVTLTAPAVLTVPQTATRSVNATSATNGVAAITMSVSASGGRAPYTYAWTRLTGSRSVASDATLPNPKISATLALAETITESWRVTATDAVGHTASSDVAITFGYPPSTLGVLFNPNAVTVTLPDPGTASATLQPTVYGGLPPYSYAWSVNAGGGTLSSISEANPTYSAVLTAGQTLTRRMFLTVTDAQNKTASSYMDVTLKAVPALTATLPATTTAPDASLSTNLAQIAVTPTISGGVTPYSISWTRLTGSRSTMEPHPTYPTYVYLKAIVVPGEKITETWQALVQDSAGHSVTAQTAVTFANPGPDLVLTVTPASGTILYQNDPGPVSTTINAAATGGVPPYSYSWVATSTTNTLTASGQNTPTLTLSGNVSAGTQTQGWKVTVTDSFGTAVTATRSLSVNAPSPLAIAVLASSTATASASTNGVAAVNYGTYTPSGGRAPYTYSWSRISGSRSATTSPNTVATQFNATLSVGETFQETWRMTVADSAGHTAYDDTVITFRYPAPAMGLTLTPTAVSVAANDPGVASGTATGAASGGVPPFSYSWTKVTGSRVTVSNPAAPNPVFSVNLAAGESLTEQWSLTATDSIGQTISKSLNTSFSAPQPFVISLAASKTVTLATTSSSGSTTMPVTVSGGRTPYTYSWTRLSGGVATINSTVTYSPTLSVTGFTVGQSAVETWQVTVSDNAGHSTSATTQITFVRPFPPVTVAKSPTAISVNGSAAGTLSGTVNVTASGGTPPYSYSWSRVSGTRTAMTAGGAASATFSATLTQPEVVSEQWKVTVTDAVGGVGETTVPVTFRLGGVAFVACSTSPTNPMIVCSLQNVGTVTIPSIAIVTSNTEMVPGQFNFSNCAANAICGSISVNRTKSGAGTVSGTLTAYPSVGLAGSYSYSINASSLTANDTESASTAQDDASTGETK